MSSNGKAVAQLNALPHTLIDFRGPHPDYADAQCPIYHEETTSGAASVENLDVGDDPILSAFVNACTWENRLPVRSVKSSFQTKDSAMHCYILLLFALYEGLRDDQVPSYLT